MQLGYFHVMAAPTSTCVQEILELTPAHLPRLVTKLYTPPSPVFGSPEYQFCTVAYLISALSNAMSSTTAACNCFVVKRRCCTSFQIADGRSFFSNDERPFKLSRLFVVDTEVRRQFHRAFYPFRDIYKGSIGEYCGIQRGIEIVADRNDGA